MKTKVYIILDLPKSVEWMIRNPYTPSLRVFKQHPLQDAGCNNHPKTAEKKLLRRASRRVRRWQPLHGMNCCCSSAHTPSSFQPRRPESRQAKACHRTQQETAVVSYFICIKAYLGSTLRQTNSNKHQFRKSANSLVVSFSNEPPKVKRRRRPPPPPPALQQQLQQQKTKINSYKKKTTVSISK